MTPSWTRWLVGPTARGQHSRRGAAFLTLGLFVVASEVAGGASPPPSGAVSFRVAPYLADLTERTVTVGFGLPEPVVAELTVETETGAVVVRAERPAEHHLLTATGLLPGQRYLYSVSAGGGHIATGTADPEHSFHTPALPGEAFVFAVYGDPRPGGSGSHLHHRRVIAGVLQLRPAFNLVLGDLVDDGGQSTQWEDFFALEAPLLRRSAIFPTLGDNDHAAGAGLGPRYLPSLDPGHYERSWGGVRFFGLRAWDTRGAQPASSFGPDSVQMRWLTTRLEDPDVQAAPFRVVFLHDPVFISRGRAAPLLQRTLAPILEAGRVDLVFASWHLYERSQRNGVVYVISGGAGAEILALPKDPAYAAQVEALRHHFCRVDVQPGALTVQAISEDGTVLDRFTLTPRSATPPDDPSRRRLRRLARVVSLGAVDDTQPAQVVVFLGPGERGWAALRARLDGWGLRAGRGVLARRVRISDAGGLELLLAAEEGLGGEPLRLPAVVAAGQGSSAGGAPDDLDAALAAAGRLAADASRAPNSRPASPWGAPQTGQAAPDDALLWQAARRLSGPDAALAGSRHALGGGACAGALALLVVGILSWDRRRRSSHLAVACGALGLGLLPALAAAGPRLAGQLGTWSGAGLLAAGPVLVAAATLLCASPWRRTRAAGPTCETPLAQSAVLPATPSARLRRAFAVLGPPLAVALAVPAGVAGFQRAGLTLARLLALAGPQPAAAGLVLAYTAGFMLPTTALAAGLLGLHDAARRPRSRWARPAAFGLLLCSLCVSAALVYTLGAVG